MMCGGVVCDIRTYQSLNEVTVTCVCDVDHHHTCSSTLPLYTLMGYMVPNVMRAMATADAVSTAL